VERIRRKSFVVRAAGAYCTFVNDPSGARRLVGRGGGGRNV